MHHARSGSGGVSLHVFCTLASGFVTDRQCHSAKLIPEGPIDGIPTVRLLHLTPDQVHQLVDGVVRRVIGDELI